MLLLLTEACVRAIGDARRLHGSEWPRITRSTIASVTGLKPTITVVLHSVKGKTTTIVAVCRGGQARGQRQGPLQSEREGEQGPQRDGELSLTKGEQAFLAKHRARELKARVKLRSTLKRAPS